MADSDFEKHIVELAVELYTATREDWLLHNMDKGYVAHQDILQIMQICGESRRAADRYHDAVMRLCAVVGKYLGEQSEPEPVVRVEKGQSGCLALTPLSDHVIPDKPGTTALSNSPTAVWLIEKIESIKEYMRYAPLYLRPGASYTLDRCTRLVRAIERSLLIAKWCEFSNSSPSMNDMNEIRDVLERALKDECDV